MSYRRATYQLPPLQPMTHMFRNISNLWSYSLDIIESFVVLPSLCTACFVENSSFTRSISPWKPAFCSWAPILNFRSTNAGLYSDRTDYSKFVRLCSSHNALRLIAAQRMLCPRQVTQDAQSKRLKTNRRRPRPSGSIYLIH